MYNPKFNYHELSRTTEEGEAYVNILSMDVDPDQINPMKDPAKIKKMLETRANNKKLNDNN